MKGYKIAFEIYAESEEEARMAQQSIIGFISQHAKQGRAVTGKKIVNALGSLEKNIFIRNQVNSFLNGRD